MFTKIGRRSENPDELAEAIAAAGPDAHDMSVPEELRPYYRVDLFTEARAWTDRDEDHLARELMRRRLAASAEEWAQVVQRMHHRTTRAALDGHRPADDYAVAAVIDAGPAAYLPTGEELDEERERITDSDRQWWVHVRRLEKAAAEKERADQRAAKAAERTRSMTCHVCGQVSARAAGYTLGVGRLTQLNGMSPGGTRLCPPCSVAVEERLRVAATLERLDDGRTRGEAAASFLAARKEA